MRPPHFQPELTTIDAFAQKDPMPTLFDPVRLGDLDLANRIVMAPLTRNRASAGEVPSALSATWAL